MKSYQLSEGVHLLLSHPLHAAPLYKAVKKNRAHLEVFLQWVSEMRTVEDTEKYLTKCANDQNEGTEWSFNIFKEDKIIGRIGLHQIDKKNNNACIGYWIAKKEQGKGIITTATQLLINYAFTVLQLHRIEILTATQNVKSAAIPLLLGFKKEGVLREMERHGNDYFDLNVFSLLAKEWHT